MYKKHVVSGIVLWVLTMNIQDTLELKYQEGQHNERERA